MKHYLKEVTDVCFKVHKDLKKNNKLKNQSHYKTNLKLMGFNVPTMREISKTKWSFSDKSLNEQFKVWNYIWHESPYFEVKSQAISFSYSLTRQELLKFWSGYKTWVSEIENWAHSDGYSSNVASLLELANTKIYPQLVKWNKSKNAWARRQSVVGLLYYAQARKKTLPLKKMLPLVENLIEDPDYYAQKGVGWTLREVGNLNQKEMLKFIRPHLFKLSSIAFTTAVEKVDKKTKDKLKTERKKNRIKKKH